MRRKFYIGFGLILLALLVALMLLHDTRLFVAILIPLLLVGLYDYLQTKHTILRNFPILGHIRYFLEFFRPEIQQYLIANDNEEKPYDRETRTIIYERAKKMRDTVPFGTERDILQNGYEWGLHSLSPKEVNYDNARVEVGGTNCQKPYNASRLNISAMSFGALSANAILALNKGAKASGFYHNTGEGGLSDYHLAGGGDIVWQIGTGYFGCRTQDGKFDEQEFQKEATHEQVKMIEIKLSQGAKPSHGGILPAAKLTEEIARIRKVPMGHPVVSPPAHTAFTNPIEMMHFVEKLRALSGGKPIGFKLCVGRKSEFLSICKAMLETKILPDFVTVDGAEGGTGAAPMEFTNHLGTPLNDALSFVHSALVGIGLRDQIRVICSGKVATGFDMICKLALGADICNAARSFMMSVGCIQSRQCNTNNCPTGVATQNQRLQRGLVVEQKWHRAMNFHDSTVNSFLDIVGAMGFKDPSGLTPDCIMRRIAPNKILNYHEIYEYLDHGSLLGNDMPQSWLFYWNQARADAF